MEKWIFDSLTRAGETFRQFMKDCYQKNLLIKNKLVLKDKKVDLRNINMPLLNVMAQFDHLVPNDASLPSMMPVSSTDKETLVSQQEHWNICRVKNPRKNCVEDSAMAQAKITDRTGRRK